MVHVIPVGTSEPQDFELQNDGSALNGTGLNVSIEITGVDDGSPSPIDPPLTVDWISAAAGTVRVQGVEIMPVGIYYARFVLTDGAGDVGYAPNRIAALEWRVVPRLSV